MTRTRVAVLASGGGTNLEAILEHFEQLGDRRCGDVVVVASDRPDAGALARARARSVAVETIATSRQPGGAALAEILDRHDVALVALAGYLRHVPVAVVHRYAARIVNVHPALLPAFGGPGMYGGRVHDAVLAAGATVTGATVHFVDEEYDRGRIIAQWPVPVLAGDTRATLAARVLRVEHLLYPRVVDAVAGGRITMASCRAGPLYIGPANTEFTMLSRQEHCLADDIDRALGL
ncbi:MAG TPA: phosphoribosylglycinamide formyltransferase [Gemmatimonadaceae bacterium]|jgi:formyltetrahydrofolate-dependent phosphoribosylglycinamide formyltransferase